MTRPVFHIALLRLSAIAVILMITSAPVDVQNAASVNPPATNAVMLPAAHSAAAYDAHAHSEASHGSATPDTATHSATAHTKDRHGHDSDCVGDACGNCDSMQRDDLFAEHCPDCFAQTPASPETIRVDRRTSSPDHANRAVDATGGVAPPSVTNSISPALSGLETRSPVLRL